MMIIFIKIFQNNYKNIENKNPVVKWTILSNKELNNTNYIKNQE